MDNVFWSVASFVLCLVFAIGVYYLEQWMRLARAKQKYYEGSTLGDIYEIKPYIDILVRAAEQLFPGIKTGEQKLNYGITLAKQLFPRLDEAVLRAIIEAAVLKFNNEQKEANFVDE